METTTKITKTELHKFLRRMLETNEVWAKAALVRIYDNQTAGEQSSAETIYANNIGFTGSDARILTSFAKFYQSRGYLSPKQLSFLMRKMGKYASQLMRMDYFSMEKLYNAYVRSLNAAV